MRGGFLLPELEFMSEVLSMDVLRANNFAQRVVVDYGFDVVDLHYYFRSQLQHRAEDGVHWDQVVHRRITNLLLAHICEAWGLGLPARKKSDFSGAGPEFPLRQYKKDLGEDQFCDPEDHSRSSVDFFGGPMCKEENQFGGLMDLEDHFGGPGTTEQFVGSLDSSGGPLWREEEIRYGGPISQPENQFMPVNHRISPLGQEAEYPHGGLMRQAQDLFDGHVTRYGGQVQEEESQYGGPIRPPESQYDTSVQPLLELTRGPVWGEQNAGFGASSESDRMQGAFHNNGVCDDKCYDVDMQHFGSCVPEFTGPRPSGRHHMRSASCDPAYLWNCGRGRRKVGHRPRGAPPSLSQANAIRNSVDLTLVAQQIQNLSKAAQLVGLIRDVQHMNGRQPTVRPRQKMMHVQRPSHAAATHWQQHKPY